MIMTHDAESIADFDKVTTAQYYKGDSYVSPLPRHKPRFSLTTLEAGPLPVVKYDGSPMGTRRQWPHIREDASNLYVIWLPLAGHVSITQDSAHDETIRVGDFVIMCGDRPFHVRSTADANDKCSQIHILVPAHIVRSQLPNVDRVCGRAFSTSSGSAKVAAEVFGAVLSEGNNISTRSAERFVSAGIDSLFETVSSATRSEPVSMDRRSAHLNRILRFINRHLAYPGLTADYVAGSCQISRRYLHDLFKDQEMTFADYIWNSRLMRAHECLTNPAFKHQNVADIALMCGFRRQSHFSVAYRNRFGLSPRQARVAGPHEPRPIKESLRTLRVFDDGDPSFMTI